MMSALATAMDAIPAATWTTAAEQRLRFGSPSPFLIGYKPATPKFGHTIGGRKPIAPFNPAFGSAAVPATMLYGAVVNGKAMPTTDLYGAIAQDFGVSFGAIQEGLTTLQQYFASMLSGLGSTHQLLLNGAYTNMQDLASQLGRASGRWATGNTRALQAGPMLNVVA